jgi:hypothetical protein
MDVGKAIRRSLAFGAIVLSLAPIAACHDDEPKQGEAKLDLDGRAAVERQDGADETLTADDRLRVGDRIRLVEGDAVLRLPGGTTLELRSGRGDADDTALVMGPKPVLQAGDLLVVTDRELTIDVADTDVTVSEGAARLGRGVGLTAGSYTADLHLDSAGAARDVGELRQLSVPSLGQPAASASPLVLDSADPWDRRFLGDAIDLGRRLEAVSNGFTASLAEGTSQTVAFFGRVLPGLAGEPAFTSDLLERDRDAGETLVGAAIADLGQRGTFADRWRSVFAFREAGADWGLVAADQGVDAEPLIGAVTGAIDRAPLETATVRPSGPVANPPIGTPSTVPGAGTGGGGSAGPTTTTTTPPAPLPSAPDDDGLLDPLLDPLLKPVTNVLNSLIGGLLGGLGGG